MTLTQLGEIATLILAGLAVIGAIAGGFHWFYRRGGQEQSFTEALNRNTKANNDVAAKLDEFKGAVLDMFHELDKRVTRTEDGLKLIQDVVSLVQKRDAQ